jgi:prepilin-type processing-associated H-X9-DG protein
LLVVIGVIALLIAILLPALSKARYQAQIVTCQARIQQFIQATHLYASDHKGSLPSLNTPMNGGYNLWDQSLLLYETLRETYKFPHTMFFCPFSREDLVNEVNGAWQAEKLGGFYRVGYCFWIPFRTTNGWLPPNPGDGQGYTIIGDDPLAGPSRQGDALANRNPIITDIVFTFAGAGTPNLNSDLSREDLGIYEYSQHLKNGRLESINVGWFDGHIERVFAKDVHPRFLSHNNYWDWR